MYVKFVEHNHNIISMNFLYGSLDHEQQTIPGNAETLPYHAKFTKSTNFSGAFQAMGPELTAEIDMNMCNSHI